MKNNNNKTVFSEKKSIKREALATDATAVLTLWKKCFHDMFNNNLTYSDISHTEQLLNHTDVFLFPPLLFILLSLTKVSLVRIVT